MNLRRTAGSLLALSFLAANAIAGTETFDTGVAPLGYNFDLGGGGGMSSTLNGINIETFCDNFANNINEPWTYQVDVSSITSTSDLSQTRFGNVTSWTTVGLGTSNTQTTINGASALARYQMAGYLIAQYEIPDGATTSFTLSNGSSTNNDSIQQAIWDILDPTSSNYLLPNIGDATSIANALNFTATWYSGTSVGQRDALLAGFMVISDPAMASCGNGPSCGFQEQMFIDAPSVPEPRGQVLMIIGLLTVCWVARRRISNRSRAQI